MHEFSLASEVVSIVTREVEKRNNPVVKEVTLEVGSLSGVDADAFESALKLLAEGSVLEKTVIIILRQNGKGRCKTCSIEFEMTKRMDACPRCQAFPAEIYGGNEFRINSMTIE